jgi:hypothetical protein
MVLMVLPLLVFAYQIYRYIVTLERENKQRACRSLGILLFPAGVILLVFRNKYSVIIGLILLMAGLRLIAYGLERKDKNIFIDRYKQ